MTQLKLWSDKYLDNFIDSFQRFNELEGEKIIEKDWREIGKENLGYWAIKGEKERKNKEERFRSSIKEIGLEERYSNVLLKILERRGIFEEGLIGLEKGGASHYKKIFEEYKQMKEDPYTFYKKNKKINNLEKDLLTFGSLSFSYSFCSPYRIIRSIVKDSIFVKIYHELMLETSDENHKLEDADFMIFDREERFVKEKYNAFAQDLRGNKIPTDILKELEEKIKFHKRSELDDYGLGAITKETLIDSFYIFFGSKLGEKFIERWKNGEDKDKLKEEFETHIYENPYINLGLINMKLKDFGTKKHISSVKEHLEWRKGMNPRNLELDFGLMED